MRVEFATALEVILRSGTKLISVNPVKSRWRITSWRRWAARGSLPRESRVLVT